MTAVLHSAAIYVFLLLIFRIAGKRSLAKITTFDLVLLLIISESTQQALTGQDYSLTQALTVIVTLVLLDVGLSLVKQRLRGFDRVMEGEPIVLVADGRPLRDRLAKERMDEDDVLEAARQLQGLERMEQIKFAVLEKSGHISIIPYS
jgi:uncharacterized membrane protein YcaP (DUF421 family)